MQPALASFILFAALVQVATAALPHGWSVCKTSSKDFYQCLARETEKAAKTLKNGDKKMGVLPLDPLVIEKLVIDQGSGPFSVKLVFENLSFKGLSDIQVRNITGSFSRWTSFNYLKKLVITGKYTIDGKVLNLPIRGTGPCTITLDDLEVKYTHTTKTIDIKGVEHLKTVSIDMDIGVKKANYQFENLFDGNKELSTAILKVMNDNWEQILNEMKTGVTKALSAAFTNITDKIFSNIPTSELIVD